MEIAGKTKALFFEEEDCPPTTGHTAPGKGTFTLLTAGGFSAGPGAENQNNAFEG